MKIACIGDQHGNIRNFIRVVDYINNIYPEIDTLIQVGDFGLMGEGFERYLLKMNKYLMKMNKYLYFIDGNHENHIWLQKKIDKNSKLSEVHLSSNIIYIPRGSIKRFNKSIILFVGGAFSVDRAYRKLNKTYWLEETLNPNEMPYILENLYKFKKIDLMISHDTPNVFNQQLATSHYKFKYNNIEDASHKSLLSYIWEEAGKPNVISGHYHLRTNLYYGNSKNIILNCDNSLLKEQVEIIEV